MDIDEFDIAVIPYKQLIVGVKRTRKLLVVTLNCSNAVDKEQGKIHLATTELFSSEKFITNYLPFSLIRRSFVQPKYQPSVENRKGLHWITYGMAEQ